MLVYYREFKFLIIPDFIGKRIDFVVSILFFQFSRTFITYWILNGFCSVNLIKVEKLSYRLPKNGFFSVKTFFLSKVLWNAQNIPLDVLYEDAVIIVLRKSFNCVVHPTNNFFKKTLVNMLLYSFPFLIKLPRAGIVHRLDKDTTGILVVAKNLYTYYNLTSQFRLRTVLKFYLALVVGVINFIKVVTTPLVTRLFCSRKFYAVAVTHFRIKRMHKNINYLHIYPETGKTHQIRKHLFSINCSILGDSFYTTPLCRSFDLCNKICLVKFVGSGLHASHVIILHPFYKRFFFFHAPVSSEIAYLCKKLF